MKIAKPFGSLLVVGVLLCMSGAASADTAKQRGQSIIDVWSANVYDKMKTVSTAAEQEKAIFAIGTLNRGLENDLKKLSCDAKQATQISASIKKAIEGMRARNHLVNHTVKIACAETLFPFVEIKGFTYKSAAEKKEKNKSPTEKSKDSIAKR